MRSEVNLNKRVGMIRMPLICRLFPQNWAQNAFTTTVKQISTQAFPLQFQVSPLLWGEPLKKKKKLDPMIVKVREERKKKRIMKEIRRLEKQEKQLKPIEEFEIPYCILDEPESRKRSVEVSEEVAEERILLFKKWSKIKSKESSSDDKMIIRLMKAQEKALNELRLESEELYQAAVRIDPELIPLKFEGPSETPAKEDYPFPDGVYIDKSRKY